MAKFTALFLGPATGCLPQFEPGWRSSGNTISLDISRPSSGGTVDVLWTNTFLVSSVSGLFWKQTSGQFFGIL